MMPCEKLNAVMIESRSTNELASANCPKSLGNRTRTRISVTPKLSTKLR
jgi:hypothetical protein